jgi:hypothetical protein
LKSEGFSFLKVKIKLIFMNYKKSRILQNEHYITPFKTEYETNLGRKTPILYDVYGGFPQLFEPDCTVITQ